MTWTYRDTIPGVSSGGPNPLDAFQIGIKIAENSVAPTDAMSVAFAFPESIASAADAAALALIFSDNNAALADTLARLAISIADSNLTPTDALALGITFSDAVGGQTDSAGIAMQFDDNNAAVSDLLLRLAIGMADSNAALTDDGSYLLNFIQNETIQEALDAMYVRIAGIADSNSAPTDAKSSVGYFWLTGSTGGNNVTNPSNADGQNDGAFAVAKTVALGATTATVTSEVGNAVPNGTSLAGGAIYRGWFKAVGSGLTSSQKVILTSNGGLFADITAFTTTVAVDHSGGTFTYDLIAAGINTLAKLQSLRVLHRSVDNVAGVGGNMSCDAGRIEIPGII